jgi:YD repeat-containing protein
MHRVAATRTSRWFSALALTLAAACSSADRSSQINPTTPAGSNEVPKRCRTYASQVNWIVAGGVEVSPMTYTFDADNHQLTKTIGHFGIGNCISTVYSYRKSVDFVEEVQVIPPRWLATSSVETRDYQCGGGVQRTTYRFDDMRRVISSTDSTAITTYVAWDASGRSTVGSRPGTTIADAYDDAARTWVHTERTGNDVWVRTVTYDTTGIELGSVSTQFGFTVSDPHVTLITQQFCE